jgi:hypothetical protein
MSHTPAPVIPADRAGLGPASESRNPVIQAVRAFTPAVDYWVPARASPFDGLAWPGRQPVCCSPDLQSELQPPEIEIRYAGKLNHLRP